MTATLSFSFPLIHGRKIYIHTDPTGAIHMTNSAYAIPETEARRIAELLTRSIDGCIVCLTLNPISLTN